MDQRRVGAFIAELRTEKSYTQAELGERLGVTNKTVSRWENGNYMPDIALLPVLCGELGIGVNELLSGQRLADSEFRAQAESNLMFTMRQHKSLQKKKIWAERFLAVGIGALVSTANSPETWRRMAVFGVSLGLIAAGWFLRWRVDCAYGIDHSAST